MGVDGPAKNAAPSGAVYGLSLGRRPKTLDQRDGSAVGFVRLEPSLAEQMARDHAVHHLQHRRDQFGLRGKLANRSGIGSESTHWRTGTRG